MAGIGALAGYHRPRIHSSKLATGMVEVRCSQQASSGRECVHAGARVRMCKKGAVRQTSCQTVHHPVLEETHDSRNYNL